MQDYITVGMLNTYITRLLDRDAHLQNFWLKGEISGFRFYQQSGHSYFTLKDEEAAVSCVMFRSKGHNLKFQPEEGMEVLLRGYVSIFARQGKYQVYVEEMQPYGTGGIYLYLEQLRERLATEGYFAPERKKKIPRIVHRVGVVTSQDGAALHDIMRVIRQRHPGAEVILSHSSVQGPEAPRELAQAVRALNEYGEIDVIIVGRGGGSLEDLMAFNSEELVVAIYESRIPIISGVGHEIDYSLSDLAADLRAATPTQAAQLAVPDYSLIQKELANLNNRMMRFMLRILTNREERLDRCMMKRIWREPGLLLQKQQNSQAELEQRLKNTINGIIKEKNHHLAMAAAGLDNLSPLKVMSRGYAILSKDKKIVKNINDIEIGDVLQADMANGRLRLLIKDKEMTDIGQP